MYKVYNVQCIKCTVYFKLTDDEDDTAESDEEESGGVQGVVWDGNSHQIVYLNLGGGLTCGNILHAKFRNLDPSQKA